MKNLNEEVKEKGKGKKKLVAWRRSQIIEYSSKGFSNAMIARALHISEPTVSRDFAFLREQAKKNITDYTNNLPLLYSQTLNGLNAILSEAWTMASQRDIDNKDKVQILSLALECYNNRIELLTNSVVVEDVIKFIDNHHKEKDKLLLSSSYSTNKVTEIEIPQNQNIPEITNRSR